MIGMQNAKKQFSQFLEHDQALPSASTNMYAQGLQMGQALRNVVIASRPARRWWTSPTRC
ncbi:hypothetical protein D0T24_27280 [Duganella sp. BJB480]|nr:hypothetical protein D0T24_27280 [Duganella sp. BJB480]